MIGDRCDTVQYLLCYKQNLGSFQFRIGKNKPTWILLIADWSKMRENSRFKIGETMW